METEFEFLLIILLVGATIVLTIWLKAYCERIGVPALIGYLLLGFLMKLLDVQELLLLETVQLVYRFLAELGIICVKIQVKAIAN